MNFLDWVLVAVAVAYGISGFRQGFVVGALSTLGLLAGGATGIVLSPLLLDRFAPSLTVSFAALVLVLFAASLGQAVGALVGAAIRERITWRPVYALDALGGAALSAAAVLLVAWALGVAVSGAGLPAMSPVVRSSTVLKAVDRTLPGRADQLLQAFNDVVDASFFPRYLEPFVPERIRPVPAPTAKVLRDRDVVRAGISVVKILGTSDECGRSVEGSGFVYAPERVMTNAHVVAGMDEPVIEVSDERYDAVPVVYNPDVDLAVLAVEGLPTPALPFQRSAELGAASAVLGYPENGPFQAVPARIRARQQLRSPDIYGDGVVIRDVWSLYAEVRPGNSGGPVVSKRGQVIGVVFAASVTDAQTGYAVTARQARHDAAAGRQRSGAVDTGDCS